MDKTNQFLSRVKPTFEIEEKSITWKSPSNIALVKYWGKSGMQIPKNPSISFTLSNCYSQTTLAFDKLSEPTEEVSFEFLFEGKKKESFRPKIASFLDRIYPYAPFIKQFHFKISSDNSFPHSSGIASSASSMSALALCMMSLEHMLDPSITPSFFKQKASFLARLGSGSACRSIEGPLVLWGEHVDFKESSNLYGLEVGKNMHDNFKDFNDAILLVDKGEKQVSSTIGHQLMIGHPYAKQRFQQANGHLPKLIKALTSGDFKTFINIVELEALSLHAMMMTSDPYFILMKANTLKIIEKIWAFRKQSSIPLCFTLDAGANVHVLFPNNVTATVKSFIERELSPFCQNNQYICDKVGFGAVQA